MATRSDVAHQLSDVDEQILDVLADGDRNPSYIAEHVGQTRQYVHQRLQLLVAADLVENLGHGLYHRSLTPLPDGGEVPDDNDAYPMECVCGQAVFDTREALDHLGSCDELGD